MAYSKYSKNDSAYNNPNENQKVIETRIKIKMRINIKIEIYIHILDFIFQW